MCLGGTAAHAEELPRHFDIPASKASEGLALFAEQSGIPLIYLNENVRNRRTNRVAGSYTATEALEILLSGTGIDGSFDERRVLTVTVEKSSDDVESESVAEIDRTPEGKGGDTVKKRGLFASIVAALAATTTVDVRADQETETKTTTQLNEIVVTAQKRKERLIDVPMSIVALNAEELTRRNIRNVDDLAVAVPGLSMQSNGYQRRIQIRGISNSATTNIGNTALIGVYLDEADVTSSATNQLNLNTFDLERVEVLRGPQGTLYGGGSAGGTVRFISKDPDLASFATELLGSFWLTTDGEPEQQINAMVNAPISSTLAVRMAAVANHGGGWIDQPVAGREDINEQDLVDVRLKALWQPSEALRVVALAEIHRNDTAPSAGEDAAGNYTQTFGQTTSPSVQSDFDILNLTATYDFGSVELLSATTYLAQESETREFGFIIPVGAINLEVLNRPHIQETESVNQELRLTSSGAGPFNWTIGAYYRDFRFDWDQTFLFGVGLPPAPAPLPPAPFLNVSESTSKSWALFSDANYALTERLTIGAGLRYYEDDQQFVTFQPAATTQEGKFDNLSPRAYLRYLLTDNANLYASASRGFRSGGFNALDQPSYGPENVWTYELGFKGSPFNRRLGIELAAFRSDYEDYQVVGLTPAAPVNITSNAGDAELTGIEGSLTLTPGSDWTLGVNGQDNETEFVSISATGTAFVVGDPLNLVPEYQFAVFAQKALALGGFNGLMRVDYTQIGEQTLKFAGDFSRSDEINLLNVAGSLDISDRLSLAVYGRNLLNDRDRTDPQEVFRFATRARPRSIGLEIRARF